MKLLRRVNWQRVINTSLRVLMFLYIVVGLIMLSTQNIGGVSFGLLMMSGAAFIYLGMVIVQQLKQVCELLAYTVFDKPTGGSTSSKANRNRDADYDFDGNHEEAVYSARPTVAAHGD